MEVYIKLKSQKFNKIWDKCQNMIEIMLEEGDEQDSPDPSAMVDEIWDILWKNGIKIYEENEFKKCNDF